MEKQKEIINELMSISKHEIQNKMDNSFFSQYIPFVGTPRKLLDDKSKIILLTDPFSKMEKFIEFPVKSIGYIEEIGTISSENNEVALKIKIWVKKGSIAVESKPFFVE